MATTYTLPAGGALVPITEAGIPGGCVITNTGTNPAGLVDNGSAVPADAWTLGAGDTFTWDTRPLWASSSSGTTITVDDNSAGQLFSSQAVASALISSGLAGDIAQQIALNGAPSIDAPGTIFSQMTPTPFGTLPTQLFDIAKYQSLFVWFNVTVTGSPVIGDLIRLYLWYYDSSGTLLDWQTIEAAGDCTIVAKMPTHGTFVKFGWNAAGGGSTYSVQLSATGSLRTVPNPQFTVTNNHWTAAAGASPYDSMMNSRYCGLEVNPLAASSHVTVFPSYCSGPCSLSLGLAGGNANSTGVHIYYTALGAETAAFPNGAPYGTYNNTSLPAWTLQQNGVVFGGQPKFYLYNNNTNPQIPYFNIQGLM